VSLSAQIAEQASAVNRNPSDGQKRAGNYRKGHIRVHGLDISIENPRGSYRSGKDARTGKAWKSRLPHHYGYIRNTTGGDGAHVDVYLGPHLKSPKVFVIDQNDLHTGGFDEHKCFLGFGSKAQAEAAYHAAFSDGRGRDRIGHMTEMDIPQFKRWLREEDTTVPVKNRAEGGRVKWDDDAADAGGVKWDDAPAEAPKKTWSDRISNMWEKATPGGPLWMAKEAWQGIKGAVDSSHDAVAAREAGSQKEYDAALGRGGPDAMRAVQFMTPGAPGGGLFAVPRALPVRPPIPPEVAANKDVAAEFKIPLSKGQATQDLDAIRYEDLSARGAYGKPAQDKAATFFDDQYGRTQEAGREIGTGLGGAHPVSDPNEAASAITGEMGDRLQQAKTIVDRVLHRSNTEAEAQRGMVADQGRAINEAVRGPAQPIENPREMGEVVGQNVRDAAAANRGEFRSRYDEFGRLPGEFRVDAVRGMGNRVQNDLTLRENPIIIDDQLTPVASRAIRDLDQMSAPRIQNRADPRAAPDPAEVTAVSLKGVDQMRKKLVAYYQAARASGPNGATDARAMQGIMDAFDAQIERAITEGLFSGDPRALAALQEARASYARYRQTFTPRGAGDDVGTAMRRITERNATPEEIANMIIGTGKIGNSGTPVRLADRLEQVLGADSDGWSAIRQAMWQKASQARNSAGEIDPAKSAQGILDFVGSSLAQRMFTPQERAAMRSHAQGIRDLERSIASHPATRDAEQAQQMFDSAFGGQGIGGGQQATFRRIVEGTATPEEVSSVVFNAIGGGNPGNVARMITAIERVTGSGSPAMAAVRQGVWQKTIANTEGRSGKGQQAVVNNISELLHGKGASVAKALYTEEQRAMMDRYAKALRLTIIPKYARTNSDTTPAIMGALRKYGAAIMASIGSILTGGAEGGFAGIGVKHLLEKGGERFTEMRNAKKVGRSLDNLEDEAPRLLPPKAPLPSYLMRNQSILGNTVRRLQGPSPTRADEEQQRP